MQNLWTCKRHGMKLSLCTRLEKVITGKLSGLGISAVLHKFSFTGWFWFDIWITTMLFLTFLALVVLQSGMHGTQIKSRRGVKEVSKLSLKTTLNTQLTQSWATTTSNHIPSEAREGNLWYSAAGLWNEYFKGTRVIWNEFYQHLGIIK